MKATDFFNAYFTSFDPIVVDSETFPNEMRVGETNESGWAKWKLIPGTLTPTSYQQLEQKYNVKFPESFIDWHRSYFFLDGDCGLIRLPASNPLRPLAELENELDWFIPTQLVPYKLYPFGQEGNDAGPLVFDARMPCKDNEYPIRWYEHEFGGELEGLGEIIFSSFTKLLECMTHYLSELDTRRNFEIIPDFLTIDPEGAGRYGRDYWLEIAGMHKANIEEFGHLG